jgi:hypothetical protein
MKLNRTSNVIVLAFILLPFASFAQEYYVEITNNTGYTITELYVSPTTLEDWEADILAGSTINTGDTRRVDLTGYESPLFDIKLVDVDGDSYTYMSVDVSERDIVATLDDLDSDQDIPQQISEEQETQIAEQEVIQRDTENPSRSLATINSEWSATEAQLLSFEDPVGDWLLHSNSPIDCALYIKKTAGSSGTYRNGSIMVLNDTGNCNISYPVWLERAGSTRRAFARQFNYEYNCSDYTFSIDEIIYYGGSKQSMTLLARFTEQSSILHYNAVFSSTLSQLEDRFVVYIDVDSVDRDSLIYACR